jgi:hypothetical protein
VVKIMVEELKRAVDASGLSRYRVSVLTEGRVSQSELSRWFAGRLNLGPDKLDAIAEVIGAKIVLV